MATFIVFALPVGAPAPTEGQPYPTTAYPTTAYITTQATPAAAVSAFAGVMKAENNSLMWAIDIANMTQYVVTRSYSAAVG